jgi:hypothetical protein
LQEAVARSAFLKADEKVASMQQMTQDLSDVMLPERTHRLSVRLRAEESTCLNLIRRTGQLLKVLKGNSSCSGNDLDTQGLTLQRMRGNLVELLNIEVNKLSEVVCKMRAHRKEDDVDRTCRLLQYAFPDATEEDIKAALVVPEIATVALAKRLDEGEERCPRLDVLSADLQTSALIMQRRLEAEAMDIELLFFRFNDLVNANDAPLSEIENNIESTLNQTNEAIANLKEANNLKRGNEKRLLMMRFCCVLVIVFMVWTFFGKFLCFFRSNSSDGGDHHDHAHSLFQEGGFSLIDRQELNGTEVFFPPLAGVSRISAVGGGREALPLAQQLATKVTATEALAATSAGAHLKSRSALGEAGMAKVGG